MFHLLFVIISYAALLLLRMPTTGQGVLSTAVLFILGSIFIVCIKLHKQFLWNNKRILQISAVLLFTASLSLLFFEHWLPSSKIRAIAALFHMSSKMMLLICGFILAVLSSYFVYCLLCALITFFHNAHFKVHPYKNILAILAAAAITVLLAQVMIGVKVFSMGLFNFIFGMLIPFVIILFLYCLIGSPLPAIALGSGFFMLISTVNAYVWKFRGRLFEPVDVFSAVTAFNVVENYSLFPMPLRLISGWIFFAAMLILFYSLNLPNITKPAVKNRAALLVVCLISSTAIFHYSANLSPRHWNKEGALFNGYILNFTASIKEISESEPDNYSNELVTKLAAQYGMPYEASMTEESTPPHIIVIMNEAFSDLRVLGEFSTNKEVIPFISSLKENTVSGYTLVSVIGGNTANSEYEFLTGNSMAWLPSSSVPYQQYVRSSAYSMASYLKSSFGYRCIAMHPYYSNGWNRPIAYSHLGFDTSIFMEDFPQENYVRSYISDREMFEFMIETWETQKEYPLFIFGVTMQNHGGYNYTGKNYTQSIFLSEYNEFPEAEQYLSLIHETDKAVEYLIHYFESIDEDVVIVFFGDHQPLLQNAFYEAVTEKNTDSLDNRQMKYKIPFFIWANYDIEEDYIDLTSLNYLSSYVYNAARIPLPPYNRFLTELSSVIPSINPNGYYSLDSAGYQSFDEANETEAYWLNLYIILQYNSIFDRSTRNELFFPVLN